MWSLGITIHQLLFNELYYVGKNKWDIEDKVKQRIYELSKEQKDKIS